MPHNHRDRSDWWKMKKAERQRIWSEAHRDHEIKESIAANYYPIHQVYQGEVLSHGFYYIHPSLH
jgi:hypothetical protein